MYAIIIPNVRIRDDVAIIQSHTQSPPIFFFSMMNAEKLGILVKFITCVTYV